MPLVHSRSTRDLNKIAEDPAGIGPHLLSSERLDYHRIKPLNMRSAEVALGTHTMVFLYCGQFRYPETAVGFVFSDNLERTRGDVCRAAPFDTGALHKVADWPSSATETAIDFLDRHYLPVPAYREHLAERLHYLFPIPYDYLHPMSGPLPGDPIGLTPKPGESLDERAWTFEVQAPDQVPLDHHHLAAVVPVKRANRNKRVRSMLANLEAKSVKMDWFSSRSKAQDFGKLQRKYLAYLGGKGILPP